MQSLKPTGLPLQRSRRVAMNSSSSIGVSKAEWPGGEKQSCPSGTLRAWAISRVTLTPGRMPPWPGLAPCEILSSTIFTCSTLACSANISTSKLPSSSRQPK